MLDGLSELNQIQHEKIGSSETLARIAQYEMAFRMQSSVPEMADLSSEPESTFERWGEEAREPGSFPNAALMARRLVERGVRFVQIYHRGWDVHAFAPEVLPAQSRDVDRASFALVQDLKDRGLFEDTLVLWGGEFGRTIYSQGKLTPTDYGRDHHPRCFSLWMAGGGVKGGVVYGETDEFSYNIIKDPVHIRDFQATLLHLFGIDRAVHLRPPGPSGQADRRRARSRRPRDPGVAFQQGADPRPLSSRPAQPYPSNPGPSRPQGFTTQSSPTTHRAPIAALLKLTLAVCPKPENAPFPLRPFGGRPSLTLHKRPSPKFQKPVRGLHSRRRIQPAYPLNEHRLLDYEIQNLRHVPLRDLTS
jgi:hypothetical protein